MDYRAEDIVPLQVFDLKGNRLAKLNRDSDKIVPTINKNNANQTIRFSQTITSRDLRNLEKNNERSTEAQYEAKENEIEQKDSIESDVNAIDKPKLRIQISEIDIDEKYKSEKLNPLYVSDSEVENESSNLQSLASNSLPDAFVTHPIEHEYCEINYEQTYLSPVNLQSFTSKLKELKSETMIQSIKIRILSEYFVNRIIVSSYMNKIWICAVSIQNLPENVYDLVHVGDIILAVNGEPLKDINEFEMFVKNQSIKEIELEIDRLPFARLIILNDKQKTFESFKNESYSKIIKEIYGMKLETNKTRIEKIYEFGSIYQAGLKYQPNLMAYDLAIVDKRPLKKSNIEDKKRFSTWTFTEVNAKPLSLMVQYEHFQKLLCEPRDEVSFVVQPTDLVKFFKNELKKKVKKLIEFI